MLAFDAGEHAYYMHYGNVRPDSVKAMWEIVNGPDVAARYAAAVAATPAGFPGCTRICSLDQRA